MSASASGALVGLTLALGLLLVASRVRAVRRPRLELRVLPYLRDLPLAAGRGQPGPAQPPTSVVAAVFGPTIAGGARLVERVLGGSASVRRRLDRAGLDRSVHDFRVEQVLWGVTAFAVCAAYGLLRSLSDPDSAWSSLVVCGVGFVLGVTARDTWLTSQVRARERAMLAEFPTLAELLALAVAAGEGPVAALDRVVQRTRGELSTELARVLAQVRTGVPVTVAFDGLAARTGVPSVARFASGVAVAIERGTPLADVLHAQAADVRDAGRRELIESAARREVLMMVPVVFLVLPVTVLFAFWPGLVGLRLTTP